jgi:hypothetical protein
MNLGVGRVRDVMSRDNFIQFWHAFEKAEDLLQWCSEPAEIERGAQELCEISPASFLIFQLEQKALRLRAMRERLTRPSSNSSDAPLELKDLS